MTPAESVKAIPKDVAFQLCAEIHQEYGGKWYTFAGWQCWGCLFFSKVLWSFCFYGANNDRGFPQQ